MFYYSSPGVCRFSITDCNRIIASTLYSKWSDFCKPGLVLILGRNYSSHPLYKKMTKAHVHYGLIEMKANFFDVSSFSWRYAINTDLSITWHSPTDECDWRGLSCEGELKLIIWDTWLFRAHRKWTNLTTCTFFFSYCSWQCVFTDEQIAMAGWRLYVYVASAITQKSSNKWEFKLKVLKRGKNVPISA